jgi:hypothetical protein
MATLSQPELSLNQVTDMPDHVNVTTTVRINLDQVDEFLLTVGLILELQSTVWEIKRKMAEIDSKNIFSFPEQRITKDGTYTFSKIVASNVLGEDNYNFLPPRNFLLNRGAEIAASFDLTSKTPIFPFNISISTEIIQKNAALYKG